MSQAEVELWTRFGSSPAGLTFWAAIGIVLSGALMVFNFSHATVYFEHFGKTDRARAVNAVAVGLLVGTGLFGLQVAQLYNITHHAFRQYASILRFDFYALSVEVFLGQWTANVACAFYAHRVYRLLGRAWYVAAIVGTFVVASAAWSFPMLVQALRMPDPSVANFETGRYSAWWQQTRHYCMVDLAIAFGRCFSTGCFMFKAVFIPRSSLFSVEKRIYRRLISLMLETMVPACVIIITLQAAWVLKAVPVVDWRRAILPVCVPLHLLFILHTLTARLKIKKILADELAANGIEAGGDTGGTGGSHVPLRNVYASWNTEKVLSQATDVNDDTSTVKLH